jgi:hypothetical protein
MSRFDGAKQGIAVWLIGLLVTIIAIAVGGPSARSTTSSTGSASPASPSPPTNSAGAQSSPLPLGGLIRTRLDTEALRLTGIESLEWE